ncbi:MAG: putative toxin-antitoxin system toxin component, PIN family [Deltaproteobacteria bacterium]|nr:putative toxin-antitoxin system toxin component, PIN family [Deltaproteobacteria bacterium]
MKIVLDTNVLVSAFLKPHSKPARILRLVIQGEVKIIINEAILAEYYEVLIRPVFKLNEKHVQTILKLIRAKGIKAPALAESFQLSDGSDEPFLEAAIACHADALVTGNLKHFPKEQCHGQNILLPAEFLNRITTM